MMAMNSFKRKNLIFFEIRSECDQKPEMANLLACIICINIVYTDSTCLLWIIITPYDSKDIRV